MEAEKAAVYGEKQALEQERTGIREELVRVEQEKMDLDTEKAGNCCRFDNIFIKVIIGKKMFIVTSSLFASV